MQQDPSQTIRAAEDSTPALKRSLTLPLLTLYGVGTMVGGGFYALLGEVAARAGMATPVAFAGAAAVALFSALSFSELSARFPSSAGEARYVFEAFRSEAFSVVVGILVILTGVVSAATLSRAIAGFVFDFSGFPIGAGVLVSVVFLAAVAAWGISESVWVAVVITAVEVGGLFLVLVLQGEHLAELPERWSELVPRGAEAWRATLLGSFLAFYAFVGFEDMVNVAEEVREPRRNMPLGILGALLLTTVLYGAVSVTALLAVPLEELTESHTPLASLVAAEGESARRALAGISVLAGVNGALVQILMAARVVYGLTRRRRSLLGWLSLVHPRTRTPVRATVLIALLVLVLAFWFPLVPLARATSSILLVVFGCVNLSLFVLRLRDGGIAPETKGPRFPIWVPALGLVTCLGFLLIRFAG